MSTTERLTIRVIENPSIWAKSIIQIVVFWTMIVLAIGLSRMWFGGSIILDLIIAFFALLGAVQMGKRTSGAYDELTYRETMEWVDCGMPDDVRAWKEKHYR